MSLFSTCPLPEAHVALEKVTTHSNLLCLLAMLQMRKRCLDGGANFGASLTNLSKAFDYLDRKHLSLQN